MTLAATSIVNSYIAAPGNQISFPFTFVVFSQSDLTVVVTSPAGAIFNLVLGTDYTVTGLNVAGGPPTTGFITLTMIGQAWITGIGLTVGWAITLTRIVSIAQNSSVRNQGDFYPEYIENALDYITMICQQLQQAITAPVLPPSLTSVTGDITITSSGNGLVVKTPDGTKTYRISVGNDGGLSAQRLT